MEKEMPGFLPDFCRVRSLLVLVAGALVLALVAALASPEPLGRLWSRFGLLAFFLVWIVLVWAGGLCLVRRRLNRLPSWQGGLLAWLWLLAASALVVLGGHWSVPLDEVAGIAMRPLLVRTLGSAAIIGVLVLRYLYELDRQRRRELAEGRARYLALQARIRPHFLFNSLNTAVSLVGSRPERAREVLLDLSDLFRASLSPEGQPSTLAGELRLARQYLDVERQRLGRRLQVRWDLGRLPQDLPVPPLLLQPLVENAVYHGVEPDESGGEVEIWGRCRDGKVVLTVSNTLPGGGADRNDRSGNRMAVDNIRQRLAVFFAEGAGLHTGLVDGRYQVRIWFPAEKRP